MADSELRVKKRDYELRRRQTCRLVQVWITNEEFSELKTAAESLGMPVATYVRHMLQKGKERPARQYLSA